jgi:hypothetical protein
MLEIDPEQVHDLVSVPKYGVFQSAREKLRFITRTL